MQINDRDKCVLSSLEAFIEVYLIINQTEILRDEYSRATKMLNTDYKQMSANLYDVIGKIRTFMQWNNISLKCYYSKNININLVVY
jgi:hypothetical protein